MYSNPGDVRTNLLDHFLVNRLGSLQGGLDLGWLILHLRLKGDRGFFRQPTYLPVCVIKFSQPLSQIVQRMFWKFLPKYTDFRQLSLLFVRDVRKALVFLAIPALRI